MERGRPRGFEDGSRGKPTKPRRRNTQRQNILQIQKGGGGKTTHVKSGSNRAVISSVPSLALTAALSSTMAAGGVPGQLGKDLDQTSAFNDVEKSSDGPSTKPQ